MVSFGNCTGLVREVYKETYMKCGREPSRNVGSTFPAERMASVKVLRQKHAWQKSANMPLWLRRHAHPGGC